MNILLLCPKDMRKFFQDLIDQATGGKSNLHIFHDIEQAAKALDLGFKLIVIAFDKNFPDNWDLESLAKAKNIKVLAIKIVLAISNRKAIIERIANHLRPIKV